MPCKWDKMCETNTLLNPNTCIKIKRIKGETNLSALRGFNEY